MEAHRAFGDATCWSLRSLEPIPAHSARGEDVEVIWCLCFARRTGCPDGFGVCANWAVAPTFGLVFAPRASGHQIGFWKSSNGFADADHFCEASPRPVPHPPRALNELPIAGASMSRGRTSRILGWRRATTASRAWTRTASRACSGSSSGSQRASPFYISVANLQSGPLFPHFSTDGTSTGQRMTKENVSADFSITMIATFGAEGAERRTTHTPRGTAAKLAAILNAPDTEVKRAGRWASEVYHIYVNEGRLEVLRNRLLNNFDKTLKRVYWFPIR
ncbi:hypothetical protein DFJ74DRAFT_160214 [Hyaloraphidium curvatum]|nr:hypothetical protein DFJ74DRAFT_160214 [Hyaloraphidium curvatum]